MLHEFITFNNVEYVLQRSIYSITNQTRLDLLEFNPIQGSFEPFMQITKEIEHVEVEDDEVIIKDYSENEGILPAMIKAEIISKPHETVNSGYVKLHICQLIK